MHKFIGSLCALAVGSCLVPVLTFSQQDQEYAPIVKVAPEYPESALANELEGHVWVRYTVTAEGLVADPEVAESSDPVFNDAAVQSVSKFRYQPRVLNGEPVAVPGVRVRVLFRLPNAKRDDIQH